MTEKSIDVCRGLSHQDRSPPFSQPKTRFFSFFLAFLCFSWCNFMNLTNNTTNTTKGVYIRARFEGVHLIHVYFFAQVVRLSLIPSFLSFVVID